MFGQVPSQTATTTLSYSLLAGVDTSLRTTDISVTITAVSNAGDCIVITSPVTLLNAGTGVTTTITTEFAGGTTCSYDITAPTTVGGLTLSTEPGTPDTSLDGTIRRTAAQLSGNRFNFEYTGPSQSNAATFSYGLFEGTNSALATTDVTLNIASVTSGCTASPTSTTLTSINTRARIQITPSLTVGGAACNYDISVATTVGSLMLAGEPGYTINTATNPDTITTAATDGDLNGIVRYSGTELSGNTFEFLYAEIPSDTGTATFSYSLLEGTDTSFSTQNIAVSITATANIARCISTPSSITLLNANSPIDVEIITTLGDGTTCSYNIAASTTAGGLSIAGEPGYELNTADNPDTVRVAAQDGNLNGRTTYTAAQLDGNTFDFLYEASATAPPDTDRPDIAPPNTDQPDTDPRVIIPPPDILPPVVVPPSVTQTTSVTPVTPAVASTTTAQIFARFTDNSAGSQDSTVFTVSATSANCTAPIGGTIHKSFDGSDASLGIGNQGVDGTNRFFLITHTNTGTDQRGSNARACSYTFTITSSLNCAFSIDLGGGGIVTATQSASNRPNSVSIVLNGINVSSNTNFFIPANIAPFNELDPIPTIGQIQYNGIALANFDGQADFDIQASNCTTPPPSSAGFDVVNTEPENSISLAVNLVPNDGCQTATRSGIFNLPAGNQNTPTRLSLDTNCQYSIYIQKGTGTVIDTDPTSPTYNFVQNQCQIGGLFYTSNGTGATNTISITEFASNGGRDIRQIGYDASLNPVLAGTVDPIVRLALFVTDVCPTFGVTSFSYTTLSKRKPRTTKHRYHNRNNAYYKLTRLCGKPISSNTQASQRPSASSNHIYKHKW